MSKVKYLKDDKVKILDKDSKLIPALEADGWKLEKPKKAEKKEEK